MCTLFALQHLDIGCVGLQEKTENTHNFAMKRSEITK